MQGHWYIKLPGNAEKGLSQHFVGFFSEPVCGQFGSLEPTDKNFKDKTECCFFTVKCKTYSIDKEESSIMILKSFSYKVISTDMLVYLNIIFNIIIQTNIYYFTCFAHIKQTIWSKRFHYYMTIRMSNDIYNIYIIFWLIIFRKKKKFVLLCNVGKGPIPMALITMVINNLYVWKLIIIMIIRLKSKWASNCIHHDCFILFRSVVHGYSERTIISGSTESIAVGCSPYLWVFKCMCIWRISKKYALKFGCLHSLDLDYWTGLLNWTTGLDYWTPIFKNIWSLMHDTKSGI